MGEIKVVKLIVEPIKVKDKICDITILAIMIFILKRHTVSKYIIFNRIDLKIRMTSQAITLNQ